MFHFPYVSGKLQKVARKYQEIMASDYFPFPDPEKWPEDDPVAYGGNLEPRLLMHAYSLGLFPWYNDDTPILWWSPDPRCVLLPDDFRLLARSARKLASKPFRLTFNQAFSKVIKACARLKRKGQNGTWITDDIMRAYIKLHELGFAHSVESWRDGVLVGGLYGVALDKAFFGESMFHLESEASRAALAGLVSLLKISGFNLIDCQQATPHMLQAGAREMPREDFLRLLAKSTRKFSFAKDDAALPWSPWLEKFEHDAAEGCWVLSGK